MVELIFISSSRAKFSNIEYLLQDSKYFITPQRNYGIGYIEPRIYNREELLQKSYIDAKNRFEKSVANAKNKFFILEDTSVIIDALSDADNEVPGLDIKYWMQEHNFAYLDKELKQKNNNRKCTVRSDIILHLPEALAKKYGKEYMVFTGMQNGYICKTEKHFETNSLYPWLDNKTFNKWFVPEAYEKEDVVISQLNISEALKYDFRKKAIEKLINFLDNENLHNYEKPDNTISKTHLFESATFILLGSTCAGKSTLATYLSKKYHYYHIEASDFMYLEYHKRHGVNPDISIGDFAQKVLENDPTIVSRQVVSFCEHLKNTPIVISGLRTAREVEYFQEHFKKDIYPIYIDTQQKIRYERCKKRNRKDVAATYESFCQKDAQQFDMGIQELENSIEHKLTNNSSYEEYYHSFEQKFGIKIHEFYIPYHKKDLEKMRLEDLILITLSRYPNETYTTTEIAKLINKEFALKKPKNKNNVSRYFNQTFRPYFDIDQSNGKNRYKINTTGLSHAKYLNLLYT